MKDAMYYIKTGIIMLLLGLESFTLTRVLLAYVRTEDYFTPSFVTIGKIAALLLAVIYTYSLTVGAWKKWEQYLVVPLPVSLGILFGLITVNPTYATISAAVSYILISYDVFLATQVKVLLIKFDARTILRVSTRGFLFLFSLLGGILVLVHSTEKSELFDISSTVADLAQTQMGMMMPSGYNPGSEEIPNDLLNQLEGKGLPIDPEQFGILSGMSGNLSSLVTGLPTVNLDLRDTVKSEVDSLIEPYKQFVTPLIAIVVYALIRFIGSIVHIFFNLSIPIIFVIARKTGWLHVSYITVQQEHLSFSEIKQLGSEPKKSPNLIPQE